MTAWEIQGPACGAAVLKCSQHGGPHLTSFPRGLADFVAHIPAGNRATMSNPARNVSTVGSRSKRARTHDSEGAAVCAGSGSCSGAAQIAPSSLQSKTSKKKKTNHPNLQAKSKTSKPAGRKGLSSCRRMPATRNEAAALQIVCAPDIAKATLGHRRRS